jgi:hypothetical protein
MVGVEVVEVAMADGEMTMWDTIWEEMLRWYRGCTMTDSDDMETDLRKVTVRTTQMSA